MVVDGTCCLCDVNVTDLGSCNLWQHLRSFSHCGHYELTACVYVCTFLNCLNVRTDITKALNVFTEQTAKCSSFC